MEFEYPSGSQEAAPDPPLYSIEGRSDVEEAARVLGYGSSGEYLLALHRLHKEGHIHVPPKNPPAPSSDAPEPHVSLQRETGTIYHGDSAVLMMKTLEPESVDLIVTRPPFGLVKRKAYGDEAANAYVSRFDQLPRGCLRPSSLP